MFNWYSVADFPNFIALKWGNLQLWKGAVIRTRCRQYFGYCLLFCKVEIYSYSSCHQTTYIFVVLFSNHLAKSLMVLRLRYYDYDRLFIFCGILETHLHICDKVVSICSSVQRSLWRFYHLSSQKSFRLVK